MKCIITLVFILCSTGLFSNRSSIRLELPNCSEKIHISYTKTIELKLYKEDSLIKTLRSNTEFGNVFKDLKKGDYSLSYKTHIGQIKKRTVSIDSTKEYSISICFDSIAKDIIKHFIPFINQLKSGETFIINFSSFGCTHDYNEKISFYCKGINSDDLIIVKYKNRSDKLSVKGKKQVEKFEEQLTSRNFKSISTTTRSYELIYKGNIIKIVESLNHFSSGYFDMLKILNLKKW